jgi:hypothetical protein
LEQLREQVRSCRFLPVTFTDTHHALVAIRRDDRISASRALRSRGTGNALEIDHVTTATSRFENSETQ